MRVVFVTFAMAVLSTSAYARECYKLSWVERGECQRSDPTYPVRYDICTALRDERGYKGEAASGHDHSFFLSDCMRRLSSLSMNELTKRGLQTARAQNYARPLPTSDPF
jgi:hypothetical protein